METECIITSPPKDRIIPGQEMKSSFLQKGVRQSAKGTNRCNETGWR